MTGEEGAGDVGPVQGLAENGRRSQVVRAARAVSPTVCGVWPHRCPARSVRPGSAPAGGSVWVDDFDASAFTPAKLVKSPHSYTV